ncbi:MAG: TonB-dependent receptor plug domain-containing protein [Gemmatimonadales bacterium]
MRRWLLTIGAVLLAPGVAIAQDPIPVVADSLAADSTAAVRDSSTTDRLLAVEGNARVQLQTTPRLGFGDLQPAGSRIVLTRDSIEWAPARTVAELLAGTAPVFLWRGGWLGRPEMPNLLARGAASVSYLVDGVPYLPIGPDSTAVDPSLWSLELLERVEIERAPGALRVFLYTRQHDRLAPRTRIAISTGDRSRARYFGSYERRYGSGIGLSLAGDFASVNAPTGGSGAAEVTNAWLQLSWRASAKLGAQLQYLVQAPDRQPLLDDRGGGVDTLDSGVVGTRGDLQFRVSWQDRPGTLGARADLLATRTAWSSDSLDESVGTFGTVLGYRRPTWSAEAQLLHHTEWTPFDGRVALGWTPAAALTGALEGVYRRHEGDRTTRLATARIGLDVGRLPAVPLLGLRLPGRLRLGGTVRTGELVQAPTVQEAPAQSLTDYEVLAALEGRLLSVEGRWSSLDVWQPLPFRQFTRVSALARQDRTEWLQVGARLAPTNWFSLATNYQHPLGGATPDGVPPHHAWTTATVNSRFLRNFPSGIFRLKVQAILETWSPGVIGRTAEGEPITQPGLTFLRGNIQFKLGPFVAFWDRVNFQAVRKGQVPGYPILSLGSVYGIRWEFLN